MDPYSSRPTQWLVVDAAARAYIVAARRGTLSLDAARRELESLMQIAHLAKDVGPNQDHQQWRASVAVDGRMQRLEIIVSIVACSQGAPPQVIHVRAKGRGGGR